VKNCDRHSEKYQIHPTSVLCAHPECVKRICLDIANRSDSIKKLLEICHNHHSSDDVVSYIVERLLIEGAEGKPYVINATFLFFTLNRFVRDEMIQLAVEDELQDDWESKLDSYSGWYKRSTPSAEGLYLGIDLIDIVSEEFGKEFALFFLGGITKTDLIKITGLGFRSLSVKLKEIREWIELNYI
jgi:hypothetical protein